jgi:hypothetical protein
MHNRIERQLRIRAVAGLLFLTVFGFGAAAKLQITTKELPDAVVGNPYNQTLSLNGSQAPNTWSIAAGSLPPAINLGASTGALTGTPTTAGTYNFTVRVVDRTGDSDTAALSIVVDPAAALVITTAALPNGAVGAQYSQTLAATGGSGGYQWSRTAGSLPGGLSLSASGAITGTPTAAGVSSFTVRVADSGGRTASKMLTMTVDAPALTISTATISAGTVGTPYSFTLASTGGRAPYAWRIADGALPGGLALAASGVISGTPAAAGTFNFSVEVTDAAGLKATRAESLVINPPSMPSFRLSGVPATLGPMQQPQVDVVLVNPYPAAITGRLNVAFVPAAGMPDDHVHRGGQRHARSLFRAAPVDPVGQRRGFDPVYGRFTAGGKRDAPVGVLADWNRGYPARGGGDPLGRGAAQFGRL